MSDAELKLAKQEAMKVDSRFLKGNVAQELADGSTGAVTDETYELLKFHGSYFGHNRDTATERKKQKLEKEYEFMVRTRIPGGRLSAQQYLTMDDLANKYANGTVRLTTRQTIQFHVIMKEHLKDSIAEINHALLSTQSACGDVVRNVMIPAAPYQNVKYQQLRDDCDKIAAFVRPKTSAYNEIFLDEEADEIRERVAGDEYEPLYGATYLPRKFKIGLIIPEDNTIDVFTHDLGFVLVYEGEKLKGYNVLLGGGMGMSHEAAKEWKDKKTYPRVADPIAFVAPDDLLNAVEAVVKLQRDHGDRSDRKHARLKYVVEEKGLAWTRSEFEKYFNATRPSQPAKDPVEINHFHVPDPMGWHEQGDGKWFLGLPVASGRVMDYHPDQRHPSGYTANGFTRFENTQYQTGIRKLVEFLGVDMVITPDQKLIFCDLEASQKADIERILKEHRIPTREDLSNMEAHFHTCVSLPTCAKALAESERVQFQIMESIQAELAKHGLQDEHMAVRVTGCPNGCSRPYVGDIGIVGRMPGHYVLFIGGDLEGTRLNVKTYDKVPLDHIPAALSPLFARFAKERIGHERFGDYCHRVGVEKLMEKVKPELEDYKWAE